MAWLKNSAGKPDAMLSMTVISFLIVSVSVVLSMFDEIKFGSSVFHIKSPDVALLSLYLGMTTTGYIVRRKQKLDKSETQEEPEKAKKNGG